MTTENDPESDETVFDIFHTLTEDDKDIAHLMVGIALEDYDNGRPISKYHPQLKRFSEKQIAVIHFLIDQAILMVKKDREAAYEVNEALKEWSGVFDSLRKQPNDES